MHDVRAVQEYAPLADRLGRDLLIQIRDTHVANKYECCGYSEGQACCVDYLVETVVCRDCRACWPGEQPECDGHGHGHCPTCGHCEHRHG